MITLKIPTIENDWLVKQYYPVKLIAFRITPDSDSS